MSEPATQAVRKHASEPATKARKATLDMSDLRPGAIELRQAICIPIEAGLENPHSAYVAMILERG